MAGFVVGVPCLPRHSRWIPKHWESAFFLKGTFPLPEEMVRFFPVAPLLRRMGRALLPSPRAFELEYLGYWIFDALIARSLSQWEANTVIAYENGARDIFRAAKRLGWKTILDAPSFHHQAQKRLCEPAEKASLFQKICRRKDEEIQLADLVLTCSEVARETYLEAGVPKEKVQSVPLGADLKVFYPDETSHSLDAPFNFLYVGTLSRHKGVDLLLQAFQEVRNNLPNCKLRLVGGAGTWLDPKGHALPKGVEWQPPLAQAQLAEEYRKADCLVLPSRFDSFGMVVAEALACGLPVLVSSMTGAKDLIQEGENGWEFPSGDEKALRTRMLWCVLNRTALRAMRPKARASALRASWEGYHGRFLEALGEC
ncbi:MAG: glycosyltransferase family 4 protein [Acidobacteria bacterium]|nr:glycosyltransferase family 4 protein [Acidobacteriota bacterium]